MTGAMRHSNVILRLRSVSLACVILAGSFTGGRQALAQGRAGGSATGQPPVLTAFSINGGPDTVSATEPRVTLVHTVVGAHPSEYRVSHRADFAGATWQPYAGAPIIGNWYDGSGEGCGVARSHRVTLYLQVRATIGEEVRIVDGQRQLVPARVESNVLRATICAHASDSPKAPPASLTLP